MCIDDKKYLYKKASVYKVHESEAYVLAIKILAHKKKEKEKKEASIFEKYVLIIS